MPAHEFVIACAGFVQVPAGVFFRPEFRVVQPPVGADFLHLAARPFPVRRGRCYRVFDSSASEISVLSLRVFQHIVCQGFQAVLVHLQAVSIHAAQAHALAVPAAFYFIAGQLAPQNRVKMRGNGLLPGVWVFLCPLHHGKAFRLRQSPRPAFLFYVAVEVPKICPRLFFGFRAILWCIGLRCVGVFLGEVGIYQLAEQSPGVLGVLVLLRLRRQPAPVPGPAFGFALFRSWGKFRLPGNSRRSYLCRTGSGAHVEKILCPYSAFLHFPEGSAFGRWIEFSSFWVDKRKGNACKGQRRAACLSLCFPWPCLAALCFPLHPFPRQEITVAILLPHTSPSRRPWPPAKV